MKKTKILLCDSNIDGTIGGSYFSLFYLVDGLNKEKYDPTVIFYTDNALISMYKEAGIKVEIFSIPKPIHIKLFSNSKILPLRKMVGLVQSAINFSRLFIGQAFKFSRYIRKNNISLIHLNNSVLRSHNWMLAAKIARVKVVSHERGLNTHFSKFARFFIKRIDAVLCISDAVKNNLVAQKVKSKNLYTVYNGLDPERVVVTKSNDVIRKEYNINHGEPIVGIVGNIKFWKGQDVVVKALSIVRDKYPSVRCLFVGAATVHDAKFEHKLDTLIENLLLHDNVIFTGYQSNVADQMNAMDVVIHASIFGEPFGRVLLEAMALKKPLIGADGGAVPEIIDDNVTGLLFKTGDHDDLAQKILFFLSDMSKAESMGELGYHRLINKYHIRLNVERTEQLYDKLLS